uniref:Uncharacterized protein n=1 Tax=Myotis myotis TaxID=51298 RepID=A0A7J7VI07_MYOMY|nr:hypothetical protein mMyoMyo1_008236 [Myotis myotis]
MEEQVFLNFGTWGDPASNLNPQLSEEPPDTLGHLPWSYHCHGVGSRADGGGPGSGAACDSARPSPCLDRGRGKGHGHQPVLPSWGAPGLGLDAGPWQPRLASGALGRQGWATGLGEPRSASSFLTEPPRQGPFVVGGGVTEGREEIP